MSRGRKRRGRAKRSLLETPWVETEVLREDGVYVLFPLRTKAQFKARKCRGVVEAQNMDGSWEHYCTTPWTVMPQPVKQMDQEARVSLAYKIGDTVIDHTRETDFASYRRMLLLADEAGEDPEPDLLYIQA